MPATACARLRGAQDGQLAVVALARGAAAARRALVARLRDVLEVDAARALQQVAARRGEVAQLARGPIEYRLGEHWIALANHAIGRQITIAHQRADAHAPVGE